MSTGIQELEGAVRPSGVPPLRGLGLAVLVLAAASTALASQVTLTWNDSAADPDGFMIERSTDGVNFTPIATVPAGVFTFVDSGLTASTNYTYSVCAFNAVGNSAFTLPVSTNPGRLLNVSCRGQIGSGSTDLTVGFIVGGADAFGTEPLLIRVSGPALAPFGITSFLPDPALELNGNSTVVASNAGWAGNPGIASTGASVGAFAWNDPASLDAALVETLPAGAYTAVATGASGDSGLGLVEVYDATPPASFTPTSLRLINISARARAGPGSSALIVGFVVGGSAPATVLIRASGPALATFGVPGVLQDPQLQVSNSAGVIDSNAGWAGNSQISAAAAIAGAFAWSSPASLDSALLVSLPPGAYTATVSGSSGDSGIALVEVYVVP